MHPKIAVLVLSLCWSDLSLFLAVSLPLKEPHCAANNFAASDDCDSKNLQCCESKGVVHKFAASKCPRVLNVHVVPHTHDDVGWRKTVEQYFCDGCNNTIDNRGSVSSILTTTIMALSEHAARTFTYVEMKFFSMWWNEQTQAMKNTVRDLIANGQLSFVNGGWCMHDEAATHFMGMIDQTTLGHSFLLRELGVVPKTGWQLDPFGHSFTHAKLLVARTGMDALYFGRIDYQDLMQRQLTAQCEGLWNTSTQNPESFDSTVFFGLTGSFRGNYGPPPGFFFDVTSHDEPLVGLNQTRLKHRINDLLHYLQVQVNQTQGNHIMLTMGTDFAYQEAHMNYANLDLMIGSVMNFQRWGWLDIPGQFGPRFDRINMFYSNPDYYTKQKLEEKKRKSKEIRWSIKYDDFFPYSDGPHSFWTGYFTSRSAFKRFERVASSFLLGARQIDAIPTCKDTSSNDSQHPLFSLEDALGVAQHHDAVSGTAKQHVADDYSKKLSDGISIAAAHVIQKLKSFMLNSDSEAALENLSYCPLLNETICKVSEEASGSDNAVMYLIVYNPVAQERSTVVRLPVSMNATYQVKRLVNGSEEEESVTEVLYPVISQSLHVFDKNKSTNYVLLFDTGLLPPVGATAFSVTKYPAGHSNGYIFQSPSKKSAATDRRLRSHKQPNGKVEFDIGDIKAQFDASTGLLTSITADGVNMTIKQEWGYYTSFDSSLDKSDDKQNSGAYIFRPSTPDQKLNVLPPKDGGALFVETAVGIEVHASYPWIKQVSRLVKGQPYIEVEYTVGPIPIEDDRGKEIVMRLSTPIKNEDTFFTDSNAREFIMRRRNYRPSWVLDVFEPVAGNYYPVNAAIYVEDEKASLAVLVDRSQGGASLAEGSLELMVQRRIVADDSRGVDEPLNETLYGVTPYPPYGSAQRVGDGVVIRGIHRIMVGKGAKGASMARSEMDGVFAEPLIFVGSASSGVPVTFQRATFSALQTSLPANIMLITCTLIDDSTLFVRLGHQFADGEDKDLSEPVEVDLKGLFVGYTVTSFTEKTLSGNQDWKGFVKRRHQEAGELSGKYNSSQARDTTIDGKVIMRPMEIRTFELTVISK